jgi:hypothetical protein
MMRRHTIIWATVALMALASGTTSVLALDPQPEPPRQLGIREKVHLPIYDSISIEQTAP